MPVNCPRCRSRIPTEDLNVAADTALCRACDEVMPLSGLVHLPSVATPEQLTPPRGAWYIDDGVEKRFGATTRKGIAFFMFPFMCLWSGFSLWALYGTQISTGKFNLGLSLFGIPFLAGSVLFWSLTLMYICGRIEVTLRGNDGRVFAGVGPIGRTRCFNLDDYSSAHRRRSSSEEITHYVELQGKKEFRFGAKLSRDRINFIIDVLNTVMVNRSLRREA